MCSKSLILTAIPSGFPAQSGPRWLPETEKTICSQTRHCFHQPGRKLIRHWGGLGWLLCAPAALRQRCLLWLSIWSGFFVTPWWLWRKVLPSLFYRHRTWHGLPSGKSLRFVRWLIGYTNTLNVLNNDFNLLLRGSLAAFCVHFFFCINSIYPPRPQVPLD